MVLLFLVAGRKPRARAECSILFLRSFRQELSANVPDLVVSAVGCYGRISALRNTICSKPQDQIGALFGKFLTDVDEHVDPALTWQEELVLLLQQADIVVIDISQSSESLQWEFAQCLKHLPYDRIICLTELSPRIADWYTPLARILMQRADSLKESPPHLSIVPYPSTRWIPKRPWRWWLFQFECKLDRAMRSIVSTSTCPPD